MGSRCRCSRMAPWRPFVVETAVQAGEYYFQRVSLAEADSSTLAAWESFRRRQSSDDLDPQRSPFLHRVRPSWHKSENFIPARQTCFGVRHPRQRRLLVLPGLRGKSGTTDQGPREIGRGTQRKNYLAAEKGKSGRPFDLWAARADAADSNAGSLPNAVAR